MKEKKYAKCEIDWEMQWALHGANFHNGYVHVPLPSIVLRLKPGPGFGDLSHPTTRLVLNMMLNLAGGNHVVDAGCGSGILSLAAKALAAESVYGIDIDPDALDHSRTNALLNNLEGIQFYLPEKIGSIDRSKNYLMLMNMIRSEQCTAWKSLEPVHSNIEKIVTSGVLLEDRKSYLNQCRDWGWHLVEEREEEGWLAFQFLHEP